MGTPASRSVCVTWRTRFVPPWMPTNADDVRADADLLRRDAETYFADVEQYFRCLDQQRREVFEQARAASEDYARVLEALKND